MQRLHLDPAYFIGVDILFNLHGYLLDGKKVIVYLYRFFVEKIKSVILDSFTSTAKDLIADYGGGVFATTRV